MYLEISWFGLDTELWGVGKGGWGDMASVPFLKVIGNGKFKEDYMCV